MRIVPVPVRSDNYAYLLIDEPSKVAAVVDPYDVNKVVEAAEREGVKIGDTVLTTHHHDDHAGGNKEFVRRFPQATVYGGLPKTEQERKDSESPLEKEPERCEAMTKPLKDNDTFNIGNISVRAVKTPCHTEDSICYFVDDTSVAEGPKDNPPKGKHGVFTGDTLFVAGCGRFFEGKPPEMVKALKVILGSLPDDTYTYPGHEYTGDNVKFALSVEPANEDLIGLQTELEKLAEDQKVDKHNGKPVTTGRYTIKQEKAHNVFMRLDVEAVLKATKETNSKPDEARSFRVMEKLREMKNNFKAK